MAYRLARIEGSGYDAPYPECAFDIQLRFSRLDEPLRWRKPRMIFVCSMGDLFHKDVSNSYIESVFDVMRQAKWHTFQVLTKRAERLEQLGRMLDWPANVWMGVSVETPQYLYRLDHLWRIPARVRFVSFEPLLESLGEINLDSIHWAIVGGESGPMARPIDEAWVIDIRDQCVAAGVPFFFKQWGGKNKKQAGRLLDGRTWDEMPHR